MKYVITIIMFVLCYSNLYSQIIIKTKILNKIKVERDDFVDYQKYQNENYFAIWKSNSNVIQLLKYNNDFEKLIDAKELQFQTDDYDNIKYFTEKDSLYLLIAQGDYAGTTKSHLIPKDIEVFKINNNLNIDTTEDKKYDINLKNTLIYDIRLTKNNHLLFFNYEYYPILDSSQIFLNKYDINNTNNYKKIGINDTIGIKAVNIHIGSNFNHIYYRSQNILSNYSKNQLMEEYVNVYNRDLEIIEKYRFKLDSNFSFQDFIFHNNSFYDIGYKKEMKTNSRDKYSIAIQKFDPESNNRDIKFIQKDSITYGYFKQNAKKLSQDNIIIGGGTGGYNEGNAIDWNSFDNFLVKLNSKCKIIWDLQFGKENVYDFINHIEKLDEENYLIVTKEADHVKLYWMRDLDVAVRESRNELVEVYPNPATSSVKLKSKLNVKNAKIIDLSGNTAGEYNESKISSDFSQNELHLDVSDLKTGTYFLILNDEIVKKFVVER